jgi:hypothetical protein
MKAGFLSSPGRASRLKLVTMPHTPEIILIEY